MENILKKKYQVIKSYILQEALPDIIALDYHQYKETCEESSYRLNYDFSYNAHDKMFNPFFYINQSFKCCSKIENSNDDFCKYMENESQFPSTNEFLAKHKKGTIYPLSKEYTSTHYIGLPIVFYIKNYKIKHNIKTKYIINKMLKTKEKNIYKFIKKELYDKDLYNKYYLKKIKDLI